MRSKRLLLFWGAFLLFVAPISLKQIVDVDIWWHMQLGRGVLEQGELPNLKAYYWSPVADERPRDLRYTWLGDLIFHETYQVAGSVGLQLLALVMLVFSAWLLARMSGKRRGPALLILLFLFVGATYQLQLLRNALFGLPATLFTFWLWWRVGRLDQTPLLWCFPPFLGLWSCLHGSYLLGFGLLALFMLGDFLDRLRRGSLRLDQRLVHHTLVLLVSYGAISIKNPFTGQITALVLAKPAELWPFLAGVALLALVLWIWLRFRVSEQRRVPLTNGLVLAGVLAAVFGLLSAHFRKFFGSPETLAELSLRAYGRTVDVEALDLLDRLKHGLNQSFWKSGEAYIASLDFFSPFDFLNHIYVWCCLLLLVAAIGLLLLHRRVALWLLLPLGALAFLGLGYVRAIGFLGIICCFILATEPWPRPGSWRPGPKTAAIVVLLLLPLPYLGAFLPGFNIGFYKDHHVGWGAAGFFPAANGPLVLEEFPEERVFTTIENGGYLLYHWQPQKAVYYDGFFAPHKGKPTADYKRARAENNPDLLYETYGVEVAIVGVRDQQWFVAFNNHARWLPMALDRGSVLFVRDSHPSTAEPVVRVNLEAGELSDIEPYLHRTLSIRLYELALNWLFKGYMVQADQMFGPEGGVVRQLADRAPANLKIEWHKLFKPLLDRYGIKNDPMILVEIQFTVNFNQRRYLSVLELGERLLAEDPDRNAVLMGMMLACKALGRADEAEAYLTRLQALTAENP